MFSRWPLIAWKGATPEYTVELKALLQRGDWHAIVLDNIGSGHALPHVEAYRAAHPDVKLFYVSHEWEYSARSGKYQSYKLNPIANSMARLDLRKVRRLERALIRRSDIVTVIADSDLVPFRKIDPSQKYLLITPGYDGPAIDYRQITKETPRRVLMLGGRRSEQKQQVLLDWLAVAYQCLTDADIEIAIAGDIGKELRNRVLTSYPRIKVLGYVDDLISLTDGARFGVIADTVGGGFKLRLLSLVFHRLPIVGLAAAVNGLPTPAGSGYLEASSLVELSSLICEEIDNLDLLNAVHNRAYVDCGRAFSWQERADQLTNAISARNKSVLI